MTDTEKLRLLDEDLALLRAEAELLESQAADTNNGILGAGRKYAKLRLAKIRTRELPELEAQRKQLAEFLAWDARTRLL